uniref:Putative secreted peptide n=1 Tax=Anopheles braziliensis TaxID=58242 RepID=A0A2M3ZUT2_9DIPT
MISFCFCFLLLFLFMGFMFQLFSFTIPVFITVSRQGFCFTFLQRTFAMIQHSIPAHSKTSTNLPSFVQAATYGSCKVFQPPPFRYARAFAL